MSFTTYAVIQVSQNRVHLVDVMIVITKAYVHNKLALNLLIEHF